MRPDPAPPRVGHIRFLNCLPLYWGLERSGGLDGLTLLPDTPDRLSDALVAGDLDVGPISLIEYLRHSDDLVLLDGLAVGADGPVQSVVLATLLPLDELDGAPVALGSTSRTSVMLARLLLEVRRGLRPAYRTMPPDLSAMLAECRAAVLIGDPALRATLAPPARVRVLDLAADWRDWTGLPMVFAVWAVRRRYAESAPAAVAAVHSAFLRSRDLVALDVDRVATEVAGTAGVAAPLLAGYFRSLDFSLGPRQLAGVAEFARLVAPYAGTDPFPDLEFFAAAGAGRVGTTP